MPKVLFIGDIVGSIGRQAVSALLPKMKVEYGIDIVIANVENSAHGSGITDRTIDEMEKAGVNYFTNGDHALRRKNQEKLYNSPNILRPANYPPGVPGQGYCLIPYKGRNILLINLVGRVFMKADYDCPFRKLDEILANIDLRANNIFAIILEMHAEASSEKAAMFHYANGRVSAVLGSHTHVQTADEKISNKGTAFITDMGMVGAEDSSLGIAIEGVIRSFITQIKEPHVIPEKGMSILNAVLLNIGANMKTKSIKRVTKKIIIN